MGTKKPLTIELSDEVSFEPFISELNFYSGNKYHEYFQNMAKKSGISESLKPDSSDFYMSIHLINNIVLKDGKTYPEMALKEMRGMNTIGAKITFNENVKYNGISLDSVVDRVYVFKVKEQKNIDFQLSPSIGYGDYLNLNMLDELRIPTELIKKING